MDDAVKLKNKLIDLFSIQPEVAEIFIFGRLAENKADRYSDVDIRIISGDPSVTQQKFHTLISKEISPIRHTFTLVSDNNCFAEMIMLQKFSPYQKIDIGIERAGFGIDFDPITSVYKNNHSSGQDQDLVLHKTQRTVDYNLDDILFGVPRFTKCIHRQHFDMFRRWKGLTNQLFCLIYESYFGWQEVSETKELNVVASKKLLDKLSTSDSKRLQQVLPLDGRLSLSISFLAALKWFIELSVEKSKAQKVYLDNDFISYIYNFAVHELKQ